MPAAAACDVPVPTVPPSDDGMTDSQPQLPYLELDADSAMTPEGHAESAGAPLGVVRMGDVGQAEGADSAAVPFSAAGLGADSAAAPGGAAGVGADSAAVPSAAAGVKPEPAAGAVEVGTGTGDPVPGI
jgi:hypothetical protein